MALVRWQPQRRIVRRPRNDIDWFLDDFFSGGFRPLTLSRALATRPASFVPKVDLKIADDEVVLRAEVPGFSKEELSLSITKDVVTLKGEHKEESEESEESEDSKDECYYCKETSHGTFERKIALPVEVDGDNAVAKLENGVLTLAIPKAGDAGTVTIDVN